MDMTLPAPAENALSQLQNTSLSPMEEALFKAWTKANQIEKPDSPDNTVDYRGVYKQTGGAILPNGELKRIAEQANSQNTLQRVLHQRMLDRVKEVTDKHGDMQQQQMQSERQDKTHAQKMEMEKLKMKQMPHELKVKETEAEMKQHDIKLKQHDIEKAKVGNEGKQIDFAASLLAPKPTAGMSAEGSPVKDSA